jgi:hypothetical protein
MPSCDADAGDGHLDPLAPQGPGQRAGEDRRLAPGVVGPGGGFEDHLDGLGAGLGAGVGGQGLLLDLLHAGLVLAQQVDPNHAVLLEDGLGVVVVAADLHDDAAVLGHLVPVAGQLLPRRRLVGGGRGLREEVAAGQDDQARGDQGHAQTAQCAKHDILLSDARARVRGCGSSG